MSISTNFPRTYYKLAETWSKRTGKRMYKDAVFGKCSQSEPISHVPHIFGEVLKQVDNLVGALQALVPDTHTNGVGLWVYDMRASDAMPRTTKDTEKLYTFVRRIIQSNWFDKDTGMYLEKHIHITVAFFVWWFTTPRFYFATNEIRQTTRYGIQRVWTPVLLPAEPVVVSTPTSSPNTKDKSPSSKHSTVTVAKDTLKCEMLQQKILALVQEEYPKFTVEWDDDRSVHRKISECFEMNSKYCITGKKSKKLQKMYQDYCKVVDKVKKNGGVAPAQAAEAQAAEEESETTCAGCLANQPNQLAHDGCLGDDAEEESEGEVPESWEDIM